MATKKFIIEVEEVATVCRFYAFSKSKYCSEVTELINHIDCDKYSLTTIKIKEYNEPTCYNLQCLGRKPNKLIENEK